MGDSDDDTTIMAIRHGAVAGALRFWARKDPKTARGLNRCADLHSSKAATLLGKIVEGLGDNPAPAARRGDDAE